MMTWRFDAEFEATLEEDIEDRILDDNSRQLLLALADVYFAYYICNTACT